MLGDFQLVYGDRQLSGPASPRLQSLIAYLLFNRGRRLPRRELAFLHWADSSEAQAQTNLRKLLYLLYRTLPELRSFLDERNQTLQWQPATGFILDVDSFYNSRSAAAIALQAGDNAAARRAFQQAVAVYEGDLLPNCYDDWVLLERERLRDLYLETLDRLNALLGGEDQVDTALTYARQLLRHDPLREATYRTLMSLHSRNGDLTGVARVYRECVKNLQRDLDAEPSAATRELYEQLTADAPRPAARMREPVLPSTLPTGTNVALPTTSFVGREAEMSALLDLARRPAVRLATVTGPPGIGKTRLAIEATRSLVGDFPAGIFYVGLAPLDDPASVLPAIADTLELPPDGGRTLPSRLAAFLHSKRVLLLLDNFEHLLPAACQLHDLLATCPALKILVTSRVPLRLQAEHELRLAPLSVPPRGEPILVETLSRYDAPRLFIERARVARPDFAPTAGNAAVIAEITRRLDALPLAIEWAAARTRFLSPKVLLPRLQNRLKLLVQGAPDLPERQQSLRSAVAWSYELLSSDEQRFFRCLAVFEPGFTAQAAEAVCAAEGESLDDISDRLTGLLEKSLLSHQEPTAGNRLPETRYTMLETIREFALERLIENREAQPARDRHARYYLALETRDPSGQQRADGRGERTAGACRTTGLANPALP